MGFSSMYFKSSGKRFDRASLIEQFKQMKNRGVRYDDLFPGSYDPIERVKEITEDKIDAEVIFNGVGTVWNGIKLCPDKDLALGLLPGLQRLDGRVPRGRPRALPLQRHAADDRPDGLPRGDAAHATTWGCAPCSSRRTPAATSPTRRSPTTAFWADGRRDGPARQRPHAVLLPGRRPRLQDHRRRHGRQQGPGPEARHRHGGRHLPGHPLAHDRSPACSSASPTSSSSAPRCSAAGCRTTSSGSTSRSSATGATGTSRCSRASTSTATCGSCTSRTSSAR